MAKGIRLKEAPVVSEGADCAPASVDAVLTTADSIEKDLRVVEEPVLPEEDEGRLETEREIRKIEMETRMSVQKNMKQGVAPDKDAKLAEELWKDVELRLMRVRNLTGPVMQALKQRHIVDIKAKAKDVLVWAQYLADSVDKL